MKRPLKKAKKRMKRVHKVQHRTAKTARGAKRRSALLIKRETTAGTDVPSPVVTRLVPGPRWALTSDGAFVLLGTTPEGWNTLTEIPKPAARALVDFVRMLDGAEA